MPPLMNNSAQALLSHKSMFPPYLLEEDSEKRGEAMKKAWGWALAALALAACDATKNSYYGNARSCGEL